MTAGRRRLLADDASTGPVAGGTGRQRASGGCTAGGVQSGHEQNITLIMIVVILVFMLCNAPARLVQVRLTTCTPEAEFHYAIQVADPVFDHVSDEFMYVGLRSARDQLSTFFESKADRRQARAIPTCRDS